MTPDAVAARAEIARWLDRADFPSTGTDLVEAALDHRAPDAVVDELRRLAEGETYERVGDVVRALGYPTETEPVRPASGEDPPGSAPRGLLALVGRAVLFLVVRDLLRAPPAEQPRAGKTLHDLPQVLHGVQQVVHVLADVAERTERREDVLVQGADQRGQLVHQRTMASTSCGSRSAANRVSAGVSRVRAGR